MGDKIRSLIEEGQKALGKEVVVMNDEEGNEEGVVDDGMEGWEEEDINQERTLSSPTNSSHRQSRRRTSHLTVNLSSAATSPTSYGRSPSSPNFKRGSTNRKRSQTGSASTSPYLDMPSSTKLGGRNFNEDNDFKVIYESPPVLSNSIHTSSDNFQDEDSRELAERMENIRKAYRIR